MTKTPVRGRGLFLAASVWLLISGIGHSIGHYFFYIDVGNFTSERAALYQSMTNYVADSLLNTSMWELLQMFSLSFGLLLFMSSMMGLLILKLNLPQESFRTATLMSVLFWLLAMALYAILNPAIQPIVISLGALLLYGTSLLRQRPV